MSANRNLMLFNLIMHDEAFRKAFMDNPQHAADAWNLDLSPQAVKMLLVIQSGDLEHPAALEDEYEGPRLCLDGIGCVPGDNRKRKPPSN